MKTTTSRVLAAVALVLGLLLSSTSWQAGAQEEVPPRPEVTVLGMVTGPDGPVAGATVFLSFRSDVMGWVPDMERATTDATGRYRFRDLSHLESYDVDVFRLRFEAEGLTPEFHADQQDPDLAAQLPFRAGETRVDAHLEAGPVFLGGRLTVAGEPVRAADVTVTRVTSPDASFSYAATRTGADGDWAVPVAPGRYRVSMGTGSAFEGPVRLRDADGDEVFDVSSTTTDLDLDLEGGVIQGRITADGQPVVARVAAHVLVEGRCEWHTSDWSHPDGGYALIGLPDAAYFVQATADVDGVELSEVYEDATTPCGRAATELPVGAGANVVVDMDLEAPADTTLSGTVTSGEGGPPLAGARISVRTASGSEVVGEAVTDADGRYSLPLLSGTYRVEVQKAGYRSRAITDAGADTVGVGPRPTVLDTWLQQHVDLVGTVTGPDGPIAGARVSVYGNTQYAPFPVATTSTDPDGHYRFTDLEHDGFFRYDSYRLAFEADGFALEFHPDQPDLELAEDIPVRPGETRIDARLDPALRLGGRLTVAGEPVRAAQVTASRLNASGEASEVANTTTTATGDWELPVRTGRYQVVLGSGEPGAAGTVPLEDSDGDTTFEVTTSRTDLDQDLPGGVVQGRITGEGQVADLARVQLSVPGEGSDCAQTAHGLADIAGYYALVGIPDGDYYLRASADVRGWSLTEVYEDSQAECSPPSTPIHVGDGSVEIDMDLVRPPIPSPTGPTETQIPVPSGSPTPTYTPSPTETSTPTPSPVPSDGPRPVILGVPRVGGVLVGLSWPRPGTTVTRQWLRDGQPVTRATGSLYAVKKADRGTTLSYRVTHARNGEVASVATSRGVRVR